MKEESYSDGKLGDGGQGSLANVESDGQGEAGNPGKGCLAPVSVCGFTSQEKTAIEQFLQEGVPQPANARARSMACAALKFAATLLLVAGVGMGVGDGNDFDDVGCSVAAKPPGCARCPGGVRPGKAGQTTPPHPNPSPAALLAEGHRGPSGQAPACGHQDEVKAVLLRLESKVDAMRLLAEGVISQREPRAAYELQKGLGGWRLVFNGRESVLPNEKGVAYAAVLLASPGEWIHGSELANRAFGDAVVAGQRNLAMDDRETAQAMGALRRRCQAVIDDEGASELEREEARAELEQVCEWARKHLRGTEGNEQRQVRAIRQALRRLLSRLGRSSDEILRAFGEHLELYVWRPSGRPGRVAKSRVRAGVAGRFIYEAPEGVRWRV